MRKSRFTESQIVEILKQGEAGVPIAEILRQHNISKATYSQRRAEYAGASVAELKRLKELEAENAKLKRMYAELALENALYRTLQSDVSRGGPGRASPRLARGRPRHHRRVARYLQHRVAHESLGHAPPPRFCRGQMPPRNLRDVSLTGKLTVPLRTGTAWKSGRCLPGRESAGCVRKNVHREAYERMSARGSRPIRLLY